MRGYFNVQADGQGISGDDVNRRLREARLGHAEPSQDWIDDCKRVIRCIYPGQTITALHLHDHYYHAPGNWAVAA